MGSKVADRKDTTKIVLNPNWGKANADSSAAHQTSIFFPLFKMQKFTEGGLYFCLLFEHSAPCLSWAAGHLGNFLLYPSFFHSVDQIMRFDHPLDQDDPSLPPANPTLEESVRTGLITYFEDLRGVQPFAVYDMVLKIIERPLFEVVMQQAAGNQSQAAKWLGINRNTLRRKLVEHNLSK
jgi:Fis family transcriptional regulator